MSEKTEQEEMSLRELLFVLRGRWWLVLAATVICTALGVLYVQVASPVYEVNSLVQLESKKDKTMSSSLGALSDLFETTNPAETEIEIIKSRMVLGRTITRLNLNIQVAPKHYFLKRLLFYPKPILKVDRFDVPAIFEDSNFVVKVIDAQNLELRDVFGNVLFHFAPQQSIDSTNNPQRIGIFVQAVSAPAGTEFSIVKHGILSTCDAISKRMTVAEIGKKSGIIGITFQDKDPNLAATTLNEITNSYVMQNVERNSAEAQQTLDFLEGQLPSIKANLEQSEEKFNRFRQSVGSVDLTEESKVALEQQVQSQQSMLDLQQKRKEALQLFKEDHPNVKTLDSMLSNLQDQANKQEKSLHSLPLRQQQVVRLMRDVQVNTELYTGMLNNVQQLRVVKAGEIGNVRIVDGALPNMNPVKPQKAVICLAALIGGFLLGAGLCVFLNAMSRGIDDPKQIEKEFDLPVYAMISHAEKQPQIVAEVKRKTPGIHVLALNYPDELALESFRSLRTTLQFGLADAPNHVITITGPAPGVGKSFVSMNAAIITAQAGFKVLLIDGDMRRGKMHRSFNLPRTNGLSEILAGTRTFEQNVVTPIKGLSFDFLATGELPPNSSELLMNMRTEEFLKYANKFYDYVIIDAPPVLAVTDATILARYAGATLLVLKAGAHDPREITAMLDRLKHSGVTAKGAVMNDVTKMRVRSYGYEYGYGYAYKKEKA